MTVRLYEVLLLTCVVNCIAGTPTPRLCPVISALGSKSDDPSSSPGQGNELCPWDMHRKKMQIPLLGLAKSIYYECWWIEYFCYWQYSSLLFPLAGSGRDISDPHRQWICSRSRCIIRCSFRSCWIPCKYYGPICYIY